jgi:nucleoside 2-deoxyribosyltransferase
MIYLCSPYTHVDPAVVEYRFESACIAAASLMKQGHIVFSPIAHSHPISKYLGKEDHQFWLRQDYDFLEQCDELIILMLDGWRESVGIKAEIEMAMDLEITISGVMLDTDGEAVRTPLDTETAKCAVGLCAPVTGVAMADYLQDAADRNQRILAARDLEEKL